MPLTSSAPPSAVPLNGGNLLTSSISGQRHIQLPMRPPTATLSLQRPPPGLVGISSAESSPPSQPTPALHAHQPLTQQKGAPRNPAEQPGYLPSDAPQGFAPRHGPFQAAVLRVSACSGVASSCSSTAAVAAAAGATTSVDIALITPRKDASAGVDDDASSAVTPAALDAEDRVTLPSRTLSQRSFVSVASALTAEGEAGEPEGVLCCSDQDDTSSSCSSTASSASFEDASTPPLPPPPPPRYCDVLPIAVATRMNGWHAILQLLPYDDRACQQSIVSAGGIAPFRLLSHPVDASSLHSLRTHAAAGIAPPLFEGGEHEWITPPPPPSRLALQGCCGSAAGAQEGGGEVEWRQDERRCVDVEAGANATSIDGAANEPSPLPRGIAVPSIRMRTAASPGGMDVQTAGDADAAACDHDDDRETIKQQHHRQQQQQQWQRQVVNQQQRGLVGAPAPSAALSLRRNTPNTSARPVPNTSTSPHPQRMAVVVPRRQQLQQRQQQQQQHQGERSAEMQMTAASLATALFRTHIAAAAAPTTTAHYARQQLRR